METTIISTIWTTIGLLLFVDYILIRIEINSVSTKIQRLQDDIIKNDIDYVKRSDILDLRNKLSDLLKDTYSQYAEIQTIYNDKLLILRNFTEERIKSCQTTVLKSLKRLQITTAPDKTSSD
jgi:hypothetical protein